MDNKRNNKFCSNSCSVSSTNKTKIHTTISNNKTSATMAGKSNPRKGVKQVCYISYCVICNKYMPDTRNKLCSSDCVDMRNRMNGQRLAATIVKRSTQEIKLFDMCNSYFSNVSNNIPIINGWDADIILNDQKIAILWNGPWHYKQMPLSNHSLLQVQTRDNIKIKALSNAGWLVLIFEDRYYTPKTAFAKIVEVVTGIEPVKPAYETGGIPLT